METKSVRKSGIRFQKKGPMGLKIMKWKVLKKNLRKHGGER
jgi:hypothetical protein